MAFILSALQDSFIFFVKLQQEFESFDANIVFLSLATKSVSNIKKSLIFNLFFKTSINL